jgi:hypothetical protein
MSSMSGCNISVIGILLHIVNEMLEFRKSDGQKTHCINTCDVSPYTHRLESRWEQNS